LPTAPSLPAHDTCLTSVRARSRPGRVSRPAARFRGSVANFLFCHRGAANCAPEPSAAADAVPATPPQAGPRAVMGTRLTSESPPSCDGRRARCHDARCRATTRRATTSLRPPSNCRVHWIFLMISHSVLPSIPLLSLCLASSLWYPTRVRLHNKECIHAGVQPTAGCCAADGRISQINECIAISTCSLLRPRPSSRTRRPSR
jgi:hypothetical protein